MLLTEAQRNRLAHFRNLVEHRTDANGRPLPGYGNNVKMLRREIASLEAQSRGEG